MSNELLEQAKASPDFLSKLRELSKSSLYFLSRAILGFSDLTPHLHQEVCNIVQDFSHKHELILLPRKHFKSTISTISLPIWIHLQDFIPSLQMRGSDVRILIANESATNSEHFLSIIENLWDTNELLNILFPELVPDKSTRKRWNAKEMLLNRRAMWPEASIETIGVGGAAQSRHYEVHILDDLIGKEAMESEVIMEKAITWYDYSESLSVSPIRYVSRVLGTRWSKKDLYQHIIEKDAKKFFVYTRECRENGKPIFPEWYTNEYYEDLLAKNPAHYLCVPGTETIITKKGIKEAKDLVIGDEVLSYTSKYKPITNIASHKANQLTQIKLFGQSKPLQLTPNHQLPCFKSFKYKATNIAPYHLGKISQFVDRKLADSYTWINAGELQKHDLLMLPISREVDEELPMSKDSEFWWFVGLWLGDGWVNKITHTINLSLSNQKHINRLDNYLATLYTNLNKFPRQGTTDVTFSYKPIYEFLPQFGDRAFNKHVPEKFMFLNANCQKQLWQGYLNADGYETKDIIGVNSTSIKLLKFFQRMLLRLNIVSCCSMIADAKLNGCSIGGRVYDQKALWNLRIYKGNSKNHRSFLYAQRLFSRVSSVETLPFDKEVYDIEVADDHSFSTEAAVVGNSQYCNNPTDPVSCDFKESWLKYYTFERQKDKLYIHFQDDDKLYPYSDLDMVGAFDPSVDEKPTASKRAITYAAMDAKERVLLIDVYSSRDTLDKVMDTLFMTHTKWRPRVFGVEVAALQRIFITIIEKESRIRKKYISCTPIKVSTNRSKDARIRDIIQPIASEGRLYIRREMMEFVQEYIEFPQGRTKDVLDAFAHCIQLLRTPFSEEEVEAEEEYEELILNQRSAITGY